MSNGVVPDIKELLAMRYYAPDIQFFNRQKVNLAVTGTQRSIARGRGMDFEEVRHYQAGDDIRLIHWPLTARLSKPFTKIYREERERAVYLIVDQSHSMHFGSRVCFKNVLAAKTAALLGWTALKHHEQVGGIIFNDNNSMYIRPARGHKTLLNLFNLITDTNSLKQTNGSLLNALQLVIKKSHSGSIVIVISDFFTLNETIKSCLKLITHKCELINFFIYDPLEAKLPENGYYSFIGDGQAKLEISANKKNCSLYATPFTNRLNQIKLFSQQNQAQLVQLATNDNLVQKINYGIHKYGY